MIYFTSDTHFGHDRAFIYKPRGFDSLEEMENKIIENWMSSGIKTVEEAKEAQEKYKSKQKTETFDADDFFEAALKRSYSDTEDDD